MLDFIWHLRGSLPLEGIASDDAALDRVASLLERQRKGLIERGPSSLAFDDPLWGDPFGPNWRAMVIYDHGRFWIEQDLGGKKLRYDLRSLHAMVFCMFGALLFSLVGLEDGNVMRGLGFAAAAFVWLYGMNALTAAGRVRTAVRNSLRDG